MHSKYGCVIMCLLHHLLQQVWVEGKGGGVTLVDSSYVEDPERFSNANTPYGNINVLYTLIRCTVSALG